MGTTTPIKDRLERIRERRDTPRPSKFATLYPTPLRKPTWRQRADEGRLFGDDGEGKVYFGGDAA